MLRTVLIGGFAAIATLAAAPFAVADDIADYVVIDENEIPKSLAGKAGDAVNGRAVAIDRKQGNCLACHQMPIPEQPFHGNIGPTLHGVGDRYSLAELRLRVVDPKVVNPDSIMPAFHRTSGLNRVMDKFQGKAILTAQQVEDVLAYLITLKE